MYIVNNETGIEDKVLYSHLLKKVKRKRKGLGRLIGGKIKEEEALRVECLLFNSMTFQNLKFLKYFRNLEEIHFMDCKIETLDGLQYTPRLEILTFSESNVKDYRAMKECPQLEIYEYISEEKPEYRRSEFDELTYLPNLWQVDLSGNNITDLSFLTKSPQLKEVVLENNPIQDLAPLQQLPQLTWLEITSCGLTSLDPLRGCRGLKTLYADNNKLTEEQKDIYKKELEHIEKLCL